MDSPEIAKNKSYWLQQAEELFMPEFAVDPQNPTDEEKKKFYSTYPEATSLYMDLAKRIVTHSVVPTFGYRSRLFKTIFEMNSITSGNRETDENGVTAAIESASENIGHLLGGAAYTIGYNAYREDNTGEHSYRKLDALIETYNRLIDETPAHLRDDDWLG